jgi:glycosyltransferase involved in cell wall biosynthesis
MSSTGDRSPAHGVGRVAIAHDYLNQRGGAERVALELTRLFPGSRLYTSLYRPWSTFPAFRQVDVQTSFLDQLPVDAGFRNVLPLYPHAFESLGPVDADVLIASSSGWAHGLRVRPPGRVVVYCHTPARWLYGGAYLGKDSAKQKLIVPLRSWLRQWDRAAAARADAYLANSPATKARIKALYGIDAAIVPPPVEVTRFRPSARGERLLVVSRLLPYKRIDLVVDAVRRAGIGLDVVGTGPALADLVHRGGSTVTFHGAADDTTVTELIQGCRALCLPGIEDFGMTPVEAQAAGKPVVAFGAGGALETVDEGMTGVFFRQHTVQDFLEAVRACDAIPIDPRLLAQRARRFSPAAFRERILAALERLPGAQPDRAGPRTQDRWGRSGPGPHPVPIRG